MTAKLNITCNQPFDDVISAAEIKRLIRTSGNDKVLFHKLKIMARDSGISVFKGGHHIAIHYKGLFADFGRVAIIEL